MQAYNEELVFNIDVVLSIPDDLAICILYRMFCEDTTAPIGATSYNLRVDGPLVSQRLRMDVA